MALFCLGIINLVLYTKSSTFEMIFTNYLSKWVSKYYSQEPLQSHLLADDFIIRCGKN